MTTQASGTALGNINFDDLPGVEPDASAPRMAKGPRFDGDTSELPDKACWALQNLVARRYLSKDGQPELWASMIEHRKVLAARLSELDLRLRVFDDLEVAYAEPAPLENPSVYGARVLRREPLGTYASIVALHLAKIARTAHDEHVLVSRDDIHELFANVSHDIDRDEAMLRDRVDEAIKRLSKAEILQRTRDDEHSYTISPVINALMSAQMIEALQRQYEQLQRGGAAPEDADGADPTDEEDGETDGDE